MKPATDVDLELLESRLNYKLGVINSKIEELKRRKETDRKDTWEYVTRSIEEIKSKVGR
jgi:hypothetical protein